MRLFKLKDDKYVANTYGRNDLFLVKGQGVKVEDEQGNEYIDLTSGIGVNSLGYCDKDWVRIVCKQARTLSHTSNLYYTAPQTILAEKLCKRTKYSKVFFGNSGAEANECAIKYARKYSFDKYGQPDRYEIISLVNSFHGRTMATLTATGQDDFHKYFFPFLSGFKYAEANDIDSLYTKLSDKTCAIMIELVQGEGGVVALNKDYVMAVSKLCDKRDIVLIVDEVQTGVGRTGTFLASEQYGIHPDITTLAKGLGGGLPIGACLVNKKLSDVFTKGTHGSTFGGNPICCSGGYEVMKKITDEVLDGVKTKGAYIRKRLAECNEVEKVTGLGLMVGIALKNKKAADVIKACMDNRLLILSAKEKLRLLPALTITDEDLEKAMDILIKVLDE